MGWSARDVPRLDGRLAVVTGANSGLGYATSRLLAERGARVILACRSPDRLAAALVRLRAEVPGATFEPEALDLASLASVRAFADRLLAREQRLDLLMNNAGIMGVDRGKTADGFELQLGVNHLGHFALTAHLLPLLLATAGSRVVNHSSFAHRAGGMHFDDLQSEHDYDRWIAYFQSKLANLLFTSELQRRLEGTATIAVAAHPGATHTDLGSEGRGPTNLVVMAFMPIVTQSAANGCLPFVRAATDPDARGGAFYGPRFLWWGAPVLERPARHARDPHAARTLWARSAELTGVEPRP